MVATYLNFFKGLLYEPAACDILTAGPGSSHDKGSPNKGQISTEVPKPFAVAMVSETEEEEGPSVNRKGRL